MPRCVAPRWFFRWLLVLWMFYIVAIWRLGKISPATFPIAILKDDAPQVLAVPVPQMGSPTHHQLQRKRKERTTTSLSGVPSNELVPTPARKMATHNSTAAVASINFCRRCKRTAILELNNRSCVDEIFRHVGGTDIFNWVPLLAFIINVSKTHEVCGQRCSPRVLSQYCPRMVTTVYNSKGNVLGVDEVAPQVLRSVSHTLPAIPPAALENRFNPDSRLENWTAGSRPLYTYNPTILPYTFDTYVATFRVSTYTRLPDAEFHNYLSVAILNATNLKILRNVIVDVNKHMGMGSRYKRRDDLGFVDFRLFHLNGTYMLSDNIYALPISIVVDDEIDINERGLANYNQSNSMPLVHGHGISIKPHGPVRHIEGLRVGRNYNFVELHRGGHSRIFVEEWPLPQFRGEGGREIAELLYNEGAGEAGSSVTTLQESTSYRLAHQIQGRDNPQPALEGHEVDFDVSPWRYSSNRGTTCCVRLEREYYSDLTANETLLSCDHLLIGIAHVKSFKKLPMNDGAGATYGYMSRFYAVSPAIPPAQMAAQSGLFCLPPAYDLSSSLSNISRPQQKRFLQWKNHTYNCPPITFASGMTSSLTDGTKLLIAYGIDDAVPNIVEVLKRDLALRLFSPVPILNAFE